MTPSELRAMCEKATKERHIQRNGATVLPWPERFCERVAVDIDAGMGRGCWYWTGNVNTDGYGLVWISKQRRALAHRMAYEIVHGTIPHNLVLDHLCRNRRCVNPGHLELCSNKENILRGVGFAATNAAKTKCKHGHDSLLVKPRSEKARKYTIRRRCSECQRLRSRRDYAKRKQRWLAAYEKGCP